MDTVTGTRHSESQPEHAGACTRVDASAHAPDSSRPFHRSLPVHTVAVTFLMPTLDGAQCTTGAPRFMPVQRPKQPPGERGAHVQTHAHTSPDVRASVMPLRSPVPAPAPDVAHVPLLSVVTRSNRLCSLPLQLRTVFAPWPQAHCAMLHAVVVRQPCRLGHRSTSFLRLHVDHSLTVRWHKLIVRRRRRHDCGRLRRLLRSVEFQVCVPRHAHQCNQHPEQILRL